MSESYTLYIPDRRGGIIQRIHTNVLAGNDEFYIYAPRYKGIPQYFQLVVGVLNVVTDATVANRYTKIERVTADGNTLLTASYGAITASLSKTHNLAPLLLAANYSGNYTSFMPEAWILYDREYIKISIASGQVGDTMEFIGDFIYKNRDWGIKEVLPNQKETE